MHDKAKSPVITPIKIKAPPSHQTAFASRHE
jgi:hypothetical protein